MSFKFTVFWWPLLFTVLLSCANEDAPYHEISEISLSGSTCLSEIPVVINDYFKSLATENEVRSVWTCLTTSFKTFSKRFRPEDNNSYTAEELREFLEDYFVDNDKLDPKTGHFISDALLDEMMGIKTLILGGSRRRLTFNEIQRSYEVFAKLNDITLNLRPYLPILLMQTRGQEITIAEYERASLELKQNAKLFFNLLGAESAIYQIASLGRLLHEFEAFIRQNNAGAKVLNMEKYVPTFASLKSLFMNSTDAYIDSNEWPFLGELIAAGIDSLLRVEYFLKANGLKETESLRALDSTFQSFVLILKKAVLRYQGRSLPVDGFEKVAKNLGDIGLLPFGLTYEDIRPMIGLFFDKIFDPGSARPLSGFNEDKIDFVAGEVSQWVKVQELLIADREDSTHPRWLEMKHLLDSPFTVSLDANNRVILDGEKGKTNLAGATRLNWLRSLFKVLFDAYTNRALMAPSARRLNESELLVAYNDLKSILIGLGLVDKNDKEFAKGMFRDASLFVPRSDGDQYVTFVELVEYIHLIFSGIDSGQNFIRSLPSDCRLENKLVDILCFRKYFPLKSNQALGHLPHYLKYAQKLSEKQWASDLKNIEVTNRSEGAVDMPISDTDIVETFVLLQYIEVIMLRFDQNRSGDLDLGEVLRALDHFKEILGDILGLDVESDREEIEIIFTYMFEYGSIPDPVNEPLADLRLRNWRLKKAQWKLAAGRGTLLQILSTLQRLN